MTVKLMYLTCYFCTENHDFSTTCFWSTCTSIRFVHTRLYQLYCLLQISMSLFGNCT